MKNSGLYLAAAIIVALTSQAVHAVQIDVKDVSRQIVTCNSELLRGMKEGTCIAIPDNTLAITTTLEAGEDASTLDEIYIAMLYQGKYYKYDGRTNGQGNKWKSVLAGESINISEPSIVRAPFETNTVARNIYLGDMAYKKGAEIYVGVKTNLGVKAKHVFTLK